MGSGGILDEGFGDRVRRVRKTLEREVGKTGRLTAVARTAGIERERFVEIEEGRTEPTSEEVVRLARVLKVRTEYLEHGDVPGGVDPLGAYLRDHGLPPIPDPEAVLRIMNAIGEAVWVFQHVEATMDDLYVGLFNAYPGMDEEEWAAGIAEVRILPLGVKARRLSKKARGLSADFEGRVATLVDERNWMIHESRREQGTGIPRGAEADRIFARIVDLIEAAGRIRSEISEACIALARGHGATDTQLYEALKSEVSTRFGLEEEE